MKNDRIERKKWWINIIILRFNRIINNKYSIYMKNQALIPDF